MSDASASMLEKHVSDFIEDGPIFHQRQLDDYLRQQGLRNVNPDELKLKLQDLGYEDTRRPPAPGEKKVRLWQPASQQRQRALTAEESEAIKATLTY